VLEALPAVTPGQMTTQMKGWDSKGASLWATAALPYQGSNLAAYGNAIAAGIG